LKVRGNVCRCGDFGKITGECMFVMDEQKEATSIASIGHSLMCYSRNVMRVIEKELVLGE
jgi:hypothetical protein